jgi:sulfate transport system permease protein
LALTSAVTTPRTRRRVGTGALVGRGAAAGYLSLIVLIPLAVVVSRALGDGGGSFWNAVTSPSAVAALGLSLVASVFVVAVNAVMGTLIAWVLVRDTFRGQRAVNALIDLPFALPTIVAGLTLIALYGPQSPIGLNLAYSKAGVALALLFVTLPFVVRAVQPVLLALDLDVEEAAAALGAGRLMTLRRIVLPALTPAILSGSALAFARAVGEFGSVVLISGNIPFNTELASVHVFGQIESDDVTGAAAVSVALLALSLAIMVLLHGVGRWRSRHER